MIKVLFVCLGNICRSPTATGVFRARAAAAGLDVRADGAGTGAWHVGEAPDPRAQEEAAKRGYDLSALRARRATALAPVTSQSAPRPSRMNPATRNRATVSQVGSSGGTRRA